MAQRSTPEAGGAFTAKHREQFLETGAVLAPGVLQPAVTDALLDVLWGMLAKKHGMLRDRPETWRNQRPAHFGELARGGAFFGMMTAELGRVLDGFFGDRGWDKPMFAPRPLLAFPSGSTDWNVPRLAWHLDGTEGKAWPDHVRIFAMLAPLEKGGGGTAFVTGSHRLVEATIAEMAGPANDRSHVRSASVIKRMRRECAWIDGLYDEAAAADRIERFVVKGAAHRGVSMRVDEMVGQAGDVVLWHPDLLHTAAPNCRATPRLALNFTVFARGMTPGWALAAKRHLPDEAES